MKGEISGNELAKRFGVSNKTIYRRIWDNSIPAYKIGGKGFWKISRKDIPRMKVTR
jgi:excisionase family DNA binding protein